MVNIANENKQIVINKKYAIGTAEVIDDSRHSEIEIVLNDRGPSHHGTWVNVNDYSTIQTTIECHENDETKKICILNFADAFKPGGGYLNGRNAQEECLCRQTLLYPTLYGNEMYDHNIEIGPTSDYMILSKGILVIRDDDKHFLSKKDQFKVDIISSAAYDNRKPNKDSYHIMEQRIAKIIRLAARESLKVRGKSALILGAFGCGVFRNDPEQVASIFANVLNEQGFKRYFDCVIFPIYKSHNMIHIFEQNLLNK